MDTALEALGGTDTTIEVRSKEKRWDMKLVDYTTGSHGPTMNRTKEGQWGQSLAPSDMDVQEKLGLTAGRGYSLAAHLLGVVICFD
jgi:hypothetical protein